MDKKNTEDPEYTDMETLNNSHKPTCPLCGKHIDTPQETLIIRHRTPGGGTYTTNVHTDCATREISTAMARVPDAEKRGTMKEK